jgi:lipoprotein-releasing system permease protein
LNLSLFIARRYLVSKRKKNFINIITLLAVVGVGFSTCALVIVLSVFNGLEDLLRSLNNSFDAQLKIEATLGKSFVRSDSLLDVIQSTEGVALVTEVIEDYAYVRYRDATQIVTLKGVGDNFLDQQRIPAHSIRAGELKLKKDGKWYALVGQGVSNQLGVSVYDLMYPLQVYYIKNTRSTSTTDPSNLYAQMNIAPGGVFSNIQNIEEQYILVPLDFAQQLLNYGDKRTSLEIKVRDGYSISKVERALEEKLGEKFQVLSEEEQHQDLYKLLRMEKLFTFLAFVLLIGITSINVYFSLMMLALEKKKDISVLSAMGANKYLIRNIFLTEGALISTIGAVLGLIIGGIICWIQQTHGLVSMNMVNSITPGYPVKMDWVDFLIIISVVVIITLLLAVRPALVASEYKSSENL